MMSRIIALIPSRSLSKRIPSKNIYPLGSHPLLAYSIQAAKDSGIFAGIYVSSDSEEIGQMGREYGAEFIHCPLTIAHKDLDPDIKWVGHALEQTPCDIFSILRPTSPFRTGDTIKRAYKQFIENEVDSIRAVEKVRQHPYKMWHIIDDRLTPLLFPHFEFHWHSQPYQRLPEIYIQNASLEMAWSRVVEEGSISGTNIMPFYTEGYEGFDINIPEDLIIAQYLIHSVEMPKPIKIKEVK